MFFTYLRRELRRRRKAALVVASGLALGIALVIVVDSVSSGMGRAQDKVLQSLYGLGTDMTVTKAAEASSASTAERPRFREVAMRFFDRGKSDFGGVLMQALRDMDAAGELRVTHPSWAAGQLMGMIEHPVFFMPLVTGDEVLPVRDPDQIAADAVETFLARYRA